MLQTNLSHLSAGFSIITQLLPSLFECNTKNVFEEHPKVCAIIPPLYNSLHVTPLYEGRLFTSSSSEAFETDCTFRCGRTTCHTNFKHIRVLRPLKDSEVEVSKGFWFWF